MERLQCLLVGLLAVDSFVPTPALAFACEFARRNATQITACILPPVGSRDRPEEAREITRLSAHEAQRLLGNNGVAIPSVAAGHSDESWTARLVRLARVNDIAVLDAPRHDEDPRCGMIDDLLAGSGRPIIVVPAECGEPSPRRIAIAWDGSAPSSRAVNDAMPFLQAADEVSIITVSGEKDLSAMTPGQDLANYLLLHGVSEVRVEMLTASGGDVPSRLRRFTRECAIDMLVLGASSRLMPRPLETRVTQSLLVSPLTPLLISA